jgi:hypothetical protein
MDTNGRCNIITDIHHFYATLKMGRNTLASWINKLGIGNYEIPEDFPPIKVTPRVADDDNDSSDGEQSYLATSALSYGSFQSTGSAHNHPPDSYSQGSTRNGPRTCHIRQ